MKCIIYNNGFIFVVILIKFKPSSLSRTSRFDNEYQQICVCLSCMPISNNDFLRSHIEAICVRLFCTYEKQKSIAPSVQK